MPPSGGTFGWPTFSLPRLKLSKAGAELVAAGATLVSRGATELAYGCGFVAVFIAAMTFAPSSPNRSTAS